MKRTAPVILVLLSMSACQKAPDEHSAAAPAASAGSQAASTAESQSATRPEAHQLAQLTRSLAEVDAQTPPPPRPERPTLFRVKEVRPGGVLVLEHGPTIELDGVQCSAAGLPQIARLLTAESVRVAFVPSAGTNTNPIPSEVWIADLSYDSSNGAPAFSMPVDTALSSGWCRPVRTPTTKRFDRYMALATLSAKHSGQ